MITRITLYSLNRRHDILEFTDISSVSEMKIWSANKFGSGTFNIQAIRRNQLEGLDMSRPIPTDSLVEIELADGEVIQGYVSEDTVTPFVYGGDIFQHEVRFIAPEKIMTKINIPPMTITQPQSGGYFVGKEVFDQSNTIIGNESIYEGDLTYFYVDNNLTEASAYSNTNFKEHGKGKGFLIGGPTSDLFTVPFNHTIVVDENFEGDLKINFNLMNPQYNFHTSTMEIRGFRDYFVDTYMLDGDVKLKLRIYIGEEIVSESDINVAASQLENSYELRSGKVTGSYRPKNPIRPYFLVQGGTVLNLKGRDHSFDASVQNYIREYSRTIKINKQHTGELKATLEIVDSNWKIKTIEQKVNFWGRNKRPDGEPTIYEKTIPSRILFTSGAVELYDYSTTEKRLDVELERVLNTIPDHSFELSDNTKNRLSELKAPELTYGQNNLYEIVRDIGLYAGGIPRIKVQSWKKKTSWIKATKTEFENTPNKIYIDTELYDSLSYLNYQYRMYPTGHAAKVAPKYKLIDVSSVKYDEASFTLDLHMEIGTWPTAADILFAMRTQEPQYYEDLDRVYGSGVVIKFDSGVDNSYHMFEESTEAFYAKVVEQTQNVEVKTIDYMFFDDMDSREVMKTENTGVQSVYRDAENYLSGVEVNLSNLVDESKVVDTGWLKLETDVASGKITTDNLTVRLPQGPIYRIEKAEMKLGQRVRISGAEEEYVPADKVYDITDRVLKEAYFNTLTNMDSHTFAARIGDMTKGQALYYKQGDDKIYNMSHTASGEPVSKWENNPQTVRAIYEIFAVKIAQEYGVNTHTPYIDSGEVEKDFTIRLRFHYIPITELKTNIYKDDQSGFREGTVRYYNEQQRMNNPSTFGRKVQQEINQMGNTHEEVDGTTNNLASVPRLSTLNKEGGRSLLSINRAFGPQIDYVATYVKDYATINEYFGIDSQYRQWEVPMENIVKRTDRKETKLYISDTPGVVNLSENYFSILEELLYNLDFSRESQAPTHAIVETLDAEGTKIVEVIRPIVSQSLGKGFTNHFAMEDNYSAGKKVVQKWETISGKRKLSHYQEDIEYGTFFGEVDVVRAKFVRIKDIEKIINNNPNYPEITRYTTQDYDLISSYEYRVQKDAREILALSQDIKFFSSAQDTIQVYEGLAKYNASAGFSADEFEVRVGILKTSLSRSATKINKNDLVWDSRNTSDVDDREIYFSVYGSGKQIVYYEKNTLEPLLTYSPAQNISGNFSGSLYIQLGDERTLEDYYTIRWRRTWDDTIIKTDKVLLGQSGTFPSERLINYEEGYVYDYHEGDYQNVDSDRLIDIYRKIYLNYTISISTAQELSTDSDEFVMPAHFVEVRSSQELELDIDAGIMESYDVNINSNQTLDATVAEGAMVSYDLHINSSQDLGINNEAGEYASYEVKIRPHQTLAVNDLAGEYASYKVNINSNQYLDVNTISGERPSYVLRIRTTQNTGISYSSSV